MPLRLPMPDYAGFAARKGQAAAQHGLRHRPLAQTLADTLAWELGRPDCLVRHAGLSDATERELLGALPYTVTLNGRNPVGGNAGKAGTQLVTVNSLTQPITVIQKTAPNWAYNQKISLNLTGCALVNFPSAYPDRFNLEK